MTLIYEGVVLTCVRVYEILRQSDDDGEVVTATFTVWATP